MVLRLNRALVVKVGVTNLVSEDRVIEVVQEVGSVVVEIVVVVVNEEEAERDENVIGVTEVVVIGSRHDEAADAVVVGAKIVTDEVVAEVKIVGVVEEVVAGITGDRGMEVVTIRIARVVVPYVIGSPANVKITHRCRTKTLTVMEVHHL